MFVADTNVISAGDPFKAARERRGLDLQASDIFLTTITVAEVRAGVLKLERIGATRKAAALAEWWGVIEQGYADRILTFDLAAARIAGQLSDDAEAAGHNPGWADVQIAAIAAARGFTVLTRNVRHFAPLGVPHLDPFAES